MYNQHNQVILEDKLTLLKTSALIYFALIAGDVLFGSVVCFINNGKMQLAMPNFADPVTRAVCLLAIICTVLSTIIYKLIIGKAKEKAIASEKFQMFLIATIVKGALLNGATLFAIVVSILTANFFFLLLATLLLIYMFRLRPTKYRIDTELNIGFDSTMDFNRT